MSEQRKRKWDSTEPADTKADEPVDMKHKVLIVDGQEESTDAETPLNRAHAVQMAIEAAKKIRADLEAKKPIDPASDQDGGSKAAKLASVEDKTAVSSDVKTSTEPAIPATGSSFLIETLAAGRKDASEPIDPLKHPFSQKIDVSGSKHIAVLSSDLFKTRLRDKLQLGPNEHFALRVDEPTDGPKTLILHASAEDILEIAERECKPVIEFGDFSGRMAKSSTTTSTQVSDCVYLGFEPTPGQYGFIRGKLLGPQGSFLKHIQTTTNTRVNLRGRGSGHVDTASPSATETPPLNLHITGSREEDVQAARQLCEDLVATAKADYESKFAPAAPSVMAPSAMGSAGPGYPYHPSYAQYYAQYAYMMAHQQQYQQQHQQPQQQQYQHQQPQYPTHPGMPGYGQPFSNAAYSNPAYYYPPPYGASPPIPTPHPQDGDDGESEPKTAKPAEQHPSSDC